MFKGANHIVANRPILAKALISLSILPSLKRDGNELHAILHSLPSVLTDGIKRCPKKGFSQIPRVA